MPHELDGEESDFPHRHEALRAIRVLWDGWLITGDPIDRGELALALAEERVRVCHGPGPLWDTFADTLPGYREMEETFAASVIVSAIRPG